MKADTREFLYALDRNIQIECVLDENAFLMAMAPTNGDNHFLKLEFTKGFALELQTFLNEHLKEE